MSVHPGALPAAPGPLADFDQLPVPPRASRQASWSSAEVWHSWPLRWADRSARSILLMSLAIGGLTASYLLPLLLERPPAVVPTCTLGAIGLLLMLFATLVAPAGRVYRCLAAYCVVLHAAGAITLVMILASSLGGPTTYGQLDAIEFLTFGVLIVAWMLLRMRHPLTVIAVAFGYAAAGAAFFSRALPSIRERLVPDPWQEQASSIDETVVRWTLIALALALVLFAWWLDGWMRALVPIANVAEVAQIGPVSRTGDRQRLRYAVVTLLLGLDVVAIALAISAKQPNGRSRIAPDDDWWASVVLALATARLIVIIFLLAGAAIWVQNGEYVAAGLPGPD